MEVPQGADPENFGEIAEYGEKYREIRWKKTFLRTIINNVT